MECQIDFGRMGLVWDPVSGRRRVTYALIFTAVYSRHMFVWLSFSQTLEAVIAGCEAAWAYFGGCFKVLIPDNMSPVVAGADAVNPRFTTGWLDYAQHCGFATDPARVRHAKDKPRVERTVQYVRSNFFAGEQFVDLADGQTRVETWCTATAGQRIHGTIQARPIEVFTQHEAGALLDTPPPYDMPIFKTVKVHRDYHIEVARALYSVPKDYIGQYLDVRVDSGLVKLFFRGQLVKVHPRQRPGGRWTDPDDLPAEVDVVSVSKIASMLDKAAENTPVPPPRPAAVGSARFARDPAEYATRRGHLRLVHTNPSGDGVDTQQVR